MNTSTRARGAFTLIELLVVIAIIALLISIIIPSLGKARKYAKLVICEINQRQLAVGAINYVTDYKDRFPGFTWFAGMRTPGNRALGVPAVLPANDDLAAAAWQAIDIIRRKSVPENPTFPTQGAWIPHIRYSHLPLLDYLGSRLPELSAMCSEDTDRREWFADPRIPRFGQTRLPYSATYNFTPSFYTPDRFAGAGSLRQGASQAYYQYIFDARYKLGNRKGSDVASPSRKIWLYDEYARHFTTKPYYYTHPAARVTTVFADGSARVIRTDETNRGGYTTATGVVQRPAPVTYSATDATPTIPWPDTFPVTQDGRYRWTVGGLKGFDIGTGL